VKDKARANLKASKTLVHRDLIDPAMSRLYYALFQAGVHALERSGRTPRSLGPYEDWKHSTVREGAYLMRSSSSDRILFHEACALREQADYRAAPVNRKRVAELVPVIEAFVTAVCS
jgi:uncharacterized protein (UPF0332 family)